MRRPLRGSSDSIPLFRVDANGAVHDAGDLSLIEPAGSLCDMATLGWPVDASTNRVWGGLPYPLYDMCPQGFLGRLFARREHEALEVAADPRGWSDDDIVWILSRRGADQCGDLILGSTALKHFQKSMIEPTDPIAASARPAAYLQLADEVLKHGLATSSAAGEFPKFTTRRQRRGCRTTHVIVKFAVRSQSTTADRWSDLLVCEAIALQHAANIQGVKVANTELLQAGSRTFLESERFDRVGDSGRHPLASLHTLNGHLLGLSTQDWRAHARALHAEGLIDDETVEKIKAIWWYGRLIANTDMHLGNLSFIPRNAKLTLAPLYDMLPMAYAPLPGGETPAAGLDFELPPPSETGVWRVACKAALEFWQECHTDQRVSAGFRVSCENNYHRLWKLL